MILHDTGGEDVEQRFRIRNRLLAIAEAEAPRILIVCLEDDAGLVNRHIFPAESSAVRPAETARRFGRDARVSRVAPRQQVHDPVVDRVNVAVADALDVQVDLGRVGGLE